MILGRAGSGGFFLDTATFEAGAAFSLNTVRINVSAGVGRLYNIEIAAPRGQRLVPGTYERAVRAVSRQGDQPGLDVAIEGSGCSALQGRFEVIEAEYGGPSSIFDVATINRFRARFQQYCDGGASPLNGEVRIMMNPWR